MKAPKIKERYTIKSFKSGKSTRWMLTGYTPSGEQIRKRFKTELLAVGGRQAQETRDQQGKLVRLAPTRLTGWPLVPKQASWKHQKAK